MLTVVILVLGVMVGRGESSAAAPTCRPYPDVSASNSACENIAWLKGKDITKPADGLYHPRSSVTRGSMAAFLFRLTHPGAASPVCHSKPFPDVPTANVFCGYITWAKSSHIAFGYSNGTYGLKRDVTRGAMAAYLSRIVNPGHSAPKCTSKPFEDVAVTSTFCPVITWMANNDITYGIGNGRYGTTGKVTRQAMASFLHRTYNLMHGQHGAPTPSRPKPPTKPGQPTITPINETVHGIKGMAYIMAGIGAILDITLVQTADPVTSGDYTATAGDRLVGFKFRLTNVGTADFVDYAPSADLTVVDDHHSQHRVPLMEQINEGQFFPSLNIPVGDTAVGYLAVEMPEGRHWAKVIYRLNDNSFAQEGIWTP